MGDPRMSIMPKHRRRASIAPLKDVFAGVLHRTQWSSGDPSRYRLKQSASVGEFAAAEHEMVEPVRTQLDPAVKKIAARAKTIRKGPKKATRPEAEAIDWGNVIEQEKQERSRDHMRAKAAKAKAKATEYAEQKRAQSMASYQKKVTKQQRQLAEEQEAKVAEEALRKKEEAEETAKIRHEEENLLRDIKRLEEAQARKLATRQKLQRGLRDVGRAVGGVNAMKSEVEAKKKRWWHLVLEEEHKKDADAAKLRAEEAFLKPLWPESSDEAAPSTGEGLRTQSRSCYTMATITA